METVDAFLTRLGLSCYASMLADEAITEVDLLRSMGEDILREVRAWSKDSREMAIQSYEPASCPTRMIATASVRSRWLNSAWSLHMSTRSRVRSSEA